MEPKGTILIVDDSKMARNTLKNYLSDKYNILEAENGLQAFEFLEDNNNEIWAILLDLVMPIIDGYMFLEKVSHDEKYKNIYEKIPIIAITSNAPDEAKILEYGVWDYIVKPYQKQIVISRIVNVINKSRVKKVSELEFMLEHDNTTKIYNKRKFYQTTREMLNKYSDKKFVFIRFDIDRFQLINYYFGTETGDILLKQLAETLVEFSNLVEICTYGKIESDIFCTCFCIEGDIIMPISFLSKKIGQLLLRFKSDYRIKMSMGIYIVEDNSASVETMYANAFLAAKTCKNSHLMTCAIYRPEMKDEILLIQELTNDMVKALENEEFSVYFQPKCLLTKGTIVGAEALVRWIHPTKGLISPTKFIPIFESNGFITSLDEFVWERTCACLRKWIDMGINVVPVSINVSRSDILSLDLPNKLISLIKKYNLSPELLHLEITESLYMSNPDLMHATVTEIKKIGFSVEMDDFGAGYSSLNTLSELPVDTLKLDMKFMKNSILDKKNENVIKSIINLARCLNLVVICEGVETKEQAAFLIKTGCNIGQGYLFSEALCEEEFLQLFNTDKIILKIRKIFEDQEFSSLSMSDITSADSNFDNLFNNFTGSLILLHYKDKNITISKVNDNFISDFKELKNNIQIQSLKIKNYIHPDDYNIFLQGVEAAVNKQIKVKFNIRILIKPVNKTFKLFHVSIKTIAQERGIAMILCYLENIDDILAGYIEI